MTNIPTENIPTLLVDVLLATKKIFGDDKYWEEFECEEGMIRFHGEFWYGVFGIEGTLGIGIPPRKPRENDGDAWEGSSNRLEWDWWSCLGFLTVPSSDYGKSIIIFIMNNSFFDRPLEVIKTIAPINYELVGSYPFEEFDNSNSTELKQLLELEFSAKFIKFEYINPRLIRK